MGGFLGETNRLPATLRGDSVQVGGIAWPLPSGTRVSDGPVDVCVRPHDFRIATGTGQPMHQALELAQIAAVADLGDGLPVALQPGAERPVGIEQFQILLARPGRTHQ